MTAKNEYLRKMDFLLNTMDIKILNLTGCWRGSTANIGIDSPSLLSDLAGKQKAVRRKLDKLKKDNTHSWMQDRELFQDAFLDFQDTFLSMVSQIDRQ